MSLLAKHICTSAVNITSASYGSTRLVKRKSLDGSFARIIGQVTGVMLSMTEFKWYVLPCCWCASCQPIRHPVCAVTGCILPYLLTCCLFNIAYRVLSSIRMEVYSHASAAKDTASMYEQEFLHTKT